LERVDGRQQLILDNEAGRLEIGRHLREPDREWLYAVLQRWYSTDAHLEVRDGDRVEPLRFGPDCITIEGRSIGIPETPNSSGEPSQGLHKRTRVVGERLIFELHPVIWAIGLAILLGGLVAAWAAVLAVIDGGINPPTLFLILLGVGVPIAGAVLLIMSARSVRYVFDRGRGVYNRRVGWRSMERPLSEIVAVQTNRGPMCKNRDEGGPNLIQTYELNLVIHDGRIRRETVARADRPKWVVELGRPVSEFLGIPFFCRV
jgi:hypothetical protein